MLNNQVPVHLGYGDLEWANKCGFSDLIGFTFLLVICFGLTHKFVAFSFVMMPNKTDAPKLTSVKNNSTRYESKSDIPQHTRNSTFFWESPSVAMPKTNAAHLWMSLIHHLLRSIYMTVALKLHFGQCNL